MTPKDAVYKNGKRYRTLSRHLQETVGRRCVKIPLSSGCTCPNRDGTCGIGGCTFCTGSGGGEFSPRSGSIPAQYRQGVAHLRKWQDAARIAYFQSFSNTYCTPDRLRGVLEETLALPDIYGIRIATRADCLPPETVAVLKEFSARIPIGLELGLQTANDATARSINRGHTFAQFCEGYGRIKAAGLPVCVHIINGLPGETREDMINTARAVAALRPDGIKIHMLHILSGSAMGRQYAKEPFELLTQDEYVGIVCEQLELLPPDTVIERLTGDGDRRKMLAPEWTMHKRTVLNAIDRELSRRDTWQGRLWEDET